MLRTVEKIGKLGIVAPWTDWEPRLVPADALAARILCERHNAALSTVDDVAGAFFDVVALTEQTIHYPAVRTTSRGGRQVAILFNGIDVERVLLKMLLGLVASGSTETQDGKTAMTPDLEPWVRVLFGEGEVGPQAGLYAGGNLEPTDSASVMMEHAVLGMDNKIWGLHFIANGLPFAFLLEPVPPPLAHFLGPCTRRPPNITFENLRVPGEWRLICLVWPGPFRPLAAR